MRKGLRSLLANLRFEIDIIDEDDHFRISNIENDVTFFFDYRIKVDPHKRPQEVSGMVEYFPWGTSSLNSRLVNTFDLNRISEVFKEWLNLVEEYELASTNPESAILTKYQQEFDEQFFEANAEEVDFSLNDQLIAFKLIELVENHLVDGDLEEKAAVLEELNSLKANLGKLSLFEFKRRFSKVIARVRYHSFKIFCDLVEAFRLLMLEEMAKGVLNSFTGLLN